MIRKASIKNEKIIGGDIQNIMKDIFITQKRRTNKRDYQIDMMKVICCIFVISIHFLMDYRIQKNILSYSVIFVESFIRVCVPVFYMCSGYFLFQKNKSLKEVYSKLLESLVFPTILVSLLIYVFFNTESPKNILGFIKILLNWDVDSVTNMFYLYFMIEMFKIYIAYPLLKMICINESEKNRIRRYIILLLMIVNVIFPTIFYISNYSIALAGYSIFGNYSFLYVLIGYELFLYFSNTNTNSKYVFIGVSLYLIGSILTYINTLYFDINKHGTFTHIFFNYETLNVLIASIGFFVLIKNICIKNNLIKKIISFCGIQSFVIYLLHYPINIVLTQYGLRVVLDKLLPHLCIYPAFVIINFIVSLLISVIFNGLIQISIHIIKRCRLYREFNKL